MTTPDYAGLAQKLHYRVENPSAWSEGFDQEASDLMEEAATALRTLLESKAELERERDAWKSECEYHERQRFSTALSLVKGGVDG